MIVGGQAEERASTIIDYHWLSWAVWPKLYWQISNSAAPETTRVNWDVRAWEMIYCLTFTWDWKMSVFDFISRTIIFSLNHRHFFEFQRHSNFNGVAFTTDLWRKYKVLLLETILDPEREKRSNFYADTKLPSVKAAIYEIRVLFLVLRRWLRCL